MVKNTLYSSFLAIFDPLRPLLDIGKPAMFGHFWSQKGLFKPPVHKIGGWQWSKLLQTNFLYVQGLGIFIVVITKNVMKKAQQDLGKNGAIIAGSMTLGHGAGGIFLSMCAKFGCSRRPRTANAPHSKPFATLMKLEKNICHLLYFFNSR